MLGAAVVAEVNGGGGVGVGEPAGGVAPAQQQGEVEGLGGGVAEGPAEHRHRIAGAPVIARQDWAEGLTAHLGSEHAAVVGAADRVAGGVGAGAAELAFAIGAAGGVPIPAAEGFAAARPGGIGLRLHRQGMGPAGLAVAFKQGELTIGDHPKPVLTAIEVPEVEVAIGRAADAAGPKAPQGHAVVGTVVQVAGVAHRVGLPPAQADGALPARGWGLPGAGTCLPGSFAQQLRFQG